MGNDLKKEATCRICSKICKKPVLLPFYRLEHHFVENEILGQKIASQEHLSRRERRTHTTVQSQLDQMANALDTSEEKLDEFTMLVAHHFFNKKKCD